MYVSYINDIGHRNNYLYMQVLQGSCVGNKQLLQRVAPNWDKFLDFCRSVRQTFHKKQLAVTSINKPVVYKCTHSTAVIIDPRFYPGIRHLLNVNNLTMHTSTVIPGERTM